MKTVVRIFGLATALTCLFAVTSVSAQTGAESGTLYGKGQDSINCVRSLSLFDGDFRNRNFVDAIENWRILWRDCPLSSVNLTQRGAQMYKYFIDRELNPATKEALIDTLMQVWERGIALRPQAQASYQTQMMQDMLRYLDTPDNQPKIQKMLEDVMAAQKEKTTALTYANYMRIIFAQHREGRLSDEELLDNYNNVNDAISEGIEKATDEKMAEELAKARDQFDETFAASTAASCANLLKIYDDKYEDNKEEFAFLQKLTRMLTRKECTDSELFEKASEQMYALSPTPAAAYNMAMLFFRKGNFEKAVEYFEEAIKNETNTINKAHYNFVLANIMLSQYQRYNDARRYVVEASKLRPDWGEPYILLANIYVAGPKCGEDAFEQAYAYWVAVDKLERARAVDPDIAGKALPLIRSYSQHFPRKEEAFFRNVVEGSTVSVGCWINESTRVRFTN